MGATKKQLEEMLYMAEAIVLHDDYGNPIATSMYDWDEIGSFEEYTVFRKSKTKTNE